MLAATAAATLPAGTGAAGAPSLGLPAGASVIPSPAIYWSRYLTGLHGCCTPRMLGTMLQVDDAAARSLLDSLIAEGHLTHAQIIAPAPQPKLYQMLMAKRVLRNALVRMREHLRAHETAPQPQPAPWS